MQLRDGARVAVVGAGPGGLVTARWLLEAGLDVTVFEAGDDLGGQWHTTSGHSGIWPGMRTNTSRTMTAFSDLPPPADHDVFPLAEQVQAYLRRYATEQGVLERIRFGTRVTSVEPGWRVDGEPYDAVVVATGRFHAPQVPAVLHGFPGELLHAYDYPGAEPLRGRRVLVYGNGVSGHEIASDLAAGEQVVSAYRKPRYVLQKLVDGVPSDWRWYTHAGALERRSRPPEVWARALRERVVRVSGHPADFGAPAPDDDLLVAGHSLSQDYLAQVRDGAVVCRPAVAAVDGRTVTFTDGSRETVDVVVSATGYDLAVPVLPEAVWSVTGPRLALDTRTFHPDVPGLAVVGQFALQGPYFPLLELQARWVAGVWSGAVPLRGAASEPPAVDAHHVLALLLAEQAGVAPDLRRHPHLQRELLLGPMVPARYRLDGPGADPGAEQALRSAWASSPLPPVDPADLAGLPELLAQA